jgi:hypothetical protein
MHHMKDNVHTRLQLVEQEIRQAKCSRCEEHRPQVAFASSTPPLSPTASTSTSPSIFDADITDFDSISAYDGEPLASSPLPRNRSGRPVAARPSGPSTSVKIKSEDILEQFIAIRSSTEKLLDGLADEDCSRKKVRPGCVASFLKPILTRILRISPQRRRGLARGTGSARIPMMIMFPPRRTKESRTSRPTIMLSANRRSSLSPYGLDLHPKSGWRSLSSCKYIISRDFAFSKNFFFLFTLSTSFAPSRDNLHSSQLFRRFQ